MDIQAKEQEIIAKAQSWNYIYVKIESEDDILLIHDAYFNDVIKESDSAIVNNYYAIYFKENKENNDIDNMIKYYLKAIDLGCIASANNLGLHYYNIENYENMLKYSLIAAERGNITSITRLALYYEKINDNQNMVKYNSLAADKGDISSIIKLYNYYKRINDEENMLKYLIMAADLGNVIQMRVLINHYFKLTMDEEAINYWLKLNQLTKNDYGELIFFMNQCIKLSDYDRLMKYYKILEKFDSIKAKQCLGKYYYSIRDYHKMINCLAIDDLLNHIQIKQDEKIILILFEINKDIFNNPLYAEEILTILNDLINKSNDLTSLIKIIDRIDLQHFTNAPKLLYLYKKLLVERIEIIDLHFNYSPDSKGFQEAKNDFIERLV